MAPYTLAYVPGTVTSPPRAVTTIRERDTVREAMDRARQAQGRHNSGHSIEMPGESAKGGNGGKELKKEGFEWSGREDSNLRPPGPEPGALPG